MRFFPIPHRSWVAGLFLLLFAQPLNKILRMTRDQVTENEGGRVIVTFDTVPIELPPDVGTLVLEHIRGRGPASYGIAGTDWLFPGRLPGRSLHTESVRRILVSHGIHPRQSRSTTLFALAGQIPTPVLADLLGISAAPRPAGQHWPHATGAATSLTADQSDKARPQQCTSADKRWRIASDAISPWWLAKGRRACFRRSLACSIRSTAPPGSTTPPATTPEVVLPVDR